MAAKSPEEMLRVPARGPFIAHSEWLAPSKAVHAGSPLAEAELASERQRATPS